MSLEVFNVILSAIALSLHVDAFLRLRRLAGWRNKATTTLPRS